MQSRPVTTSFFMAPMVCAAHGVGRRAEKLGRVVHYSGIAYVRDVTTRPLCII